jgi:hypothetical protein
MDGAEAIRLVRVSAGAIGEKNRREIRTPTKETRNQRILPDGTLKRQGRVRLRGVFGRADLRVGCYNLFAEPT